MNTIIEFHDSEVAAVEAAEGALTIRFSAAWARRADAAGDTGYMPDVVLRLDQPAWSGDLAACVGRLSGGELCVGAQQGGCVPLPFEAKGPVRMRLAFSNGAVLSAEASAVRLVQTGEARFVESLNC